MQRYARISTAIIFGVTTLLTTSTFLFFWRLPEANVMLLPQLSPAQIFGSLWPATLTALLFGAVLGGLFARTTQARLGLVYAACLGYVTASPLLAIGSWQLQDAYFGADLRLFAERMAATVPEAVAQLSGRVESPFWLTAFFWLSGPLTGVVVWTWLRYRAAIFAEV